MLFIVFFEDFDIIFFVVFFRNICGLVVLLIGWNSFLSFIDIIKVVDIVCIRIYWNEVFVYVNRVLVDVVRFNIYWVDIEKLLVRFGGLSY